MGDVSKDVKTEVIPIESQETQIMITKKEYDDLLKKANEDKEIEPPILTIFKNPDSAKIVKDIINDVSKSLAESRKQKAKYSVLRMGIVAIILILVLLAASALVYVGRFDGGSLTFLLGTITGYLLTFLTKVENPG